MDQQVCEPRRSAYLGRGRSIDLAAVLSIAAACLIGSMLCHAGNNETPSPVMGESSPAWKDPGTEGTIAGHLPSQIEQAQAALVPEAPPRGEAGSSGWWAPSSDRRFEKLTPYSNA
jgi:hypothetical protein